MVLAAYIGIAVQAPAEEVPVVAEAVLGVWEKRASYGKEGLQVRFYGKLEEGGKATLIIEKLEIPAGSPIEPEVQSKEQIETKWVLDGKDLKIGPFKVGDQQIEQQAEPYTILHLSPNFRVAKGKRRGDLSVVVRTDEPQNPKVLKGKEVKIDRYRLRGDVVVGLLPERSIQVAGKPATAMWIDEETKHLNYAIGSHLEYHGPSKVLIIRGSPAVVTGTQLIQNSKGTGIGVLLPDDKAIHEDGSKAVLLDRDPTEEMEFDQQG